MVNSLLERKARYLAAKQKKQKIVRGVLVACGLCLLLGGGWMLRQWFSPVHISGLMPALTEQEMIEKSHLIVKGTFEDKSKAFQVRSADQTEESNFTDYYLTVEEVYRGDAVAGDIIAVRIQGGFVGTVNVVSDMDPEINVGDTVFVHLYQPGIGGGFETNEDYYYVLSGIDGLFHYEDETTLVNPKTKGTKNIPELKAEIQRINQTTPVNKNWVYEESLENAKKNLETGFITEKEYNEMLKEQQTYGTVTKKALIK